MPNRSDVEERERELLEIQPALLGGSIVTFDDLFKRIARGGSESRQVATEAQQALIVRRALAGQSLNGLGRSARFGGFADALLSTVGELESGLLDPNDLEGELAGLYAVVPRRARSAQPLGPRPASAARRRPGCRRARRLGRRAGLRVRLRGSDRSRVGAPAGARRTQRRDRVDARTSRGVLRSHRFAARWRISPRSRTGGSRSFPRRSTRSPSPRSRIWSARSSRRRCRRHPRSTAPCGSSRAPASAARSSSSVRSCCRCFASGVEPEQIGLICPSLERWQAPLETAFGTLGVPYALEAYVRFDRTAFGQALLSLLRFGWLGGGRADLYAFLRSPYSGLTRQNVDFLEGRLRGRAVQTPERVEEETMRLRDGQPLPVLEALRGAPTPLDAVAGLAAFMLRSAYGLEAPPVGELSRQDIRAHESVMRLVAELRGWSELDGSLSPEEVVAALERAEVRRSSPGEAGRIAVIDLLRARTRRFEIVFVLGLEEGSLPRRGHESPFLGDDARRELDERSRARLTRPDQVARDRYLFYAACTRASRRLYLVREAATDEGSPREPSPFWDEVQAVFPKDDVARWTRRRPLSDLTWPLEDAPTERERLRSVALRAAGDATCGGRDRDGERLGATARPRAARLRAADPADASAGARRVGAQDHLRSDRARAVRRVLVDLVLRPCDRPEEHRRRGRRPAARLDRPPGSVPLLLRTAEGARHRPRRAGSRRGRGGVPLAGASTKQSRRVCASSSRSWRRASFGTACGATSKPSCAKRRLRTCRFSRAASRCCSAPSGRRPSCNAGSSWLRA